MELSQPPCPTEIGLRLAFDETAGVLQIGWAASPPVNLGSTLAYRLDAEQARALARALEAYAGRSST